MRSRTDTTTLLSEVRRQILKWETAQPSSREENEAAEAATRAMAELDAALCDGADLPVPWQLGQYPKEETARPPDPATNGESGKWGESVIPGPDPEPDTGQGNVMRGDAERASLARRLEAGGHGGCAFDLESAADQDVVAVAYAIVQHLEEGCGAPREDDQILAEDIQRWADRHDRDLRGHDG